MRAGRLSSALMADIVMHLIAVATQLTLMIVVFYTCLTMSVKGP